MNAFAAAGAAFLVCVLWFDLMFDVQVRGHYGEVPANALASISGYYRRVTREAWPMNRLIAVVMLLTLVFLVAEIFLGYRWWAWLLSLLAAAFAIGLARVRTIPNAARLGKASDSAEEQSRLARAIYKDHIYCIAAMTLVLVLQLGAHGRHHHRHKEKQTPTTPQSAVL
jgi:hypothetical protein